MSKSIVSISYLKKKDEEGKVVLRREHVKCTLYGKFLLDKSSMRPNNQVKYLLSAYDFISNNDVSSGDPVLTFKNGNKLRVYQGGDRTYMLTEARSLIDLHDSSYVKQRLAKKSNSTSCYLDYEDLPDYWLCP
jgi:hypothetical protein